MSIGPAVRRAMGPIEAPVSNAYRAMFLDVGALGRDIAAIDFGPRVLEVGVGDGLIAGQIVSHRSDATVLGIDLITNPGVHFDADRSRAEFRTQSTSELLAEGPAPFDTVVIADVLHHVPPTERVALLADVDALLDPNGVLLVKETVVVRSPGYWMGHFSDRFITGDKGVSFLTEPDLRRLVTTSVAGLQLCARSTIRPWRTNLLLAWRRGSGTIEQ